MNTPVSFSIDKLLKEKGFDKYGYLQDVWLGNKYEWKRKGKNKKSVEISVFELGSSSVLPTIADVVMWLYEKHGIWISVVCDVYGKLWYARLHSASESLWRDDDKRHEVITAYYKFPNEHDTPTKSYEAAFEYTLNNLIKKAK